ncbi:MAG: hypothetical protein ACPL4K_01455 [Candidatus Margulisiibacteriota bacterium]
MVGFLIALIFVPVSLLLVFSILGILLIPLWVMLIGAGWLFGYVAAGHFLGKKIIYAFKIYGRSMMTETLVGIIILSLIGIVPVGGTLVKVITSLCGLGGVYWTRFGSR